MYKFHAEGEYRYKYVEDRFARSFELSKYIRGVYYSLSYSCPGTTSSRARAMLVFFFITAAVSHYKVAAKCQLWFFFYGTSFMGIN